jgi:hypothetical protein
MSLLRCDAIPFGYFVRVQWHGRETRINGEENPIEDTHFGTVSPVDFPAASARDERA